MIILVWLIGFITNLLNPVGLFLVGLALAGGEPEMLIVPLIFGVVGFVYGLWAWKYEVAPRMFWVKGKSALFDNRMGCAWGYFLSFLNSAMVVVTIVTW